MSSWRATSIRPSWPYERAIALDEAMILDSFATRLDLVRLQIVADDLDANWRAHAPVARATHEFGRVPSLSDTTATTKARAAQLGLNQASK